MTISLELLLKAEKVNTQGFLVYQHTECKESLQSDYEVRSQQELKDMLDWTYTLPCKHMCIFCYVSSKKIISGYQFITVVYHLAQKLSLNTTNP